MSLLSAALDTVDLASSSTAHLMWGVPHGSVLGSRLFYVCMLLLNVNKR